MEPEEEPGGAAVREVYEEVSGILSYTLRSFTRGGSGFLPVVEVLLSGTVFISLAIVNILLKGFLFSFYMVSI